MTKDNWIKAKELRDLLNDIYWQGCSEGGERSCGIDDYRVEAVKSFISQVEKDAIEKTKEELKGFDTGRNWYFEGDELVITKGKWVIDRYKKRASLKQEGDSHGR